MSSPCGQPDTEYIFDGDAPNPDDDDPWFSVAIVLIVIGLFLFCVIRKHLIGG